MSALAEALVAAQRRALTALQSAYVAERIDREAFVAIMDSMGTADAVDQERLLHALDAIRFLGAPMPAEPTNGGAEKKPEGATDAQLALIADLVQKHHLEAPDLPLTKQDASAIITAMKDGSYDAAKWKVPF